ncbi:guanylate kinase [Campylobacter sp. MOP51]|uniref:guanylate kinase n=1 Tax=Campylobacter canis TaxID=3378588 RepID=UPI003C496138
MIQTQNAADKVAVLIVGPSGSGKSTLEALLETKYGYKKLVSSTTRPKRAGEVEGKPYNFITEPEFERLIKADALIEHVNYSGNFYGLSKKEVLSAGKSSVFVVEPSGVPHIVNFMKEHEITPVTVYVHVSPDIVRERMAARGDSPEAIAKRIDQDDIAKRAENMRFDVFINSNITNPEEGAVQIDNLVQVLRW